MTVAHEIKYPWFQYKPWPKRFRKDPNPWTRKHNWEEMPEAVRRRCEKHWPEGYRGTFITIWHVDPEKGGSDDSCGYSYIRLTPKQREVLRNTAWSEGRNPHFLKYGAKEFPGEAEEAECYYRGLALLVARVLRLKLSWDYICRFAAEAVHVNDGVGRFGGAFCFLPGYHTNSQKDSQEERQDHFHGVLCGIARNILTDLRPWWKHPRWHFWHWKFQCHPLGHFKRWAFSRCCKCGKGFRWGYSVVTNSWNGTGPLWFRSEKDVYHSDCNQAMDSCVAQEACKSEP